MLLAPLILAAATVPQDAALEACLAVADTSAAFSQCYSAAIERSDDTLNSRWKRVTSLLSDYPPEAKASLLNEQRAWIAFKDKSCEFYWGAGFGSMHRSLIGPACRLQIIDARIADLDTIITSLETE